MLAVTFAAVGAASQGVAVGAQVNIARGAHPSAGLNGANAAYGLGALAAPFLPPLLAFTAQRTSAYASIGAILAFSALPFIIPRPVGVGNYAVRQTTELDDNFATFDEDSYARLPDGSPPPSPTGPAPHAARNGIAFKAAVMTLVCAAVGAEANYSVWLFVHALEGQHMPVALASGCLSLFWLGVTAGRLLAFLAASRGAAPATLLRYSLPLALIAPAVALASPGSATLLATSAAAGLGLSAAFANAVGLMATRLRPTGRTQALIQLAACAGGIFLAPLSGELTRTGVLGTEAFLVVAAVCAGTALTALAAAELAAERLPRRSE